MTISFINLNKSNLSVLEHLIFFPAHKVKVRKEISSLIGVVAVVDDIPAAIALAERNGVIFYLRVLPAFQGRGIEYELISHLEKLFQEQGQHILSLTYECEASEALASTKGMMAHGWEEPFHHITLFIGETGRLKQDQWFQQDFTSENQEIFSWSNLPEQERNSLKAKKDIQYPDIYDPFSNEQNIALEYSFGLIENNRLSGWIVCEEVAQNTIFVRTMYTPDQFGARRASLSLLNTCFGAIYSKKEYPFVMFAVESSNTNAQKIVKKRFGSGVIREKLYFKTQKTIDR